MWRKSNEARPNPAASKTPAPAGTAETQKQTQAASNQTSTSQQSSTSNQSSSSQQNSTTAGQTNGSSTAANSAKPAAATPVANTTSASAASVATTPAPAASAAVPPATTAAPAAASAAKNASAWTVPQAPAPTPQPVRTEEPSTISAGLKIKGEITGTSDLTIDGETQGKVRLTNGRVTVGPKGRVVADIDAREIVVNGTVQGNLKASDSVRLGPSGHVEGSILTARIGIDDGARLRGNVEMIRAGETPESSKRGQDAQTARAATASASQDSD